MMDQAMGNGESESQAHAPHTWNLTILFITAERIGALANKPSSRPSYCVSVKSQILREGGQTVQSLGHF